MAIQHVFQQALQCYQQTKYAEAAALLNRITAAAPGHPAGWHLLALTLRKLGQLADSERCFNTSLQLNPADADILNNFANLKRQQGNLLQAEQMFRQAIKLKPTFVDAWYNLALLCVNQKRHAKACDCLHKVLRLDPRHRAALLALTAEYLRSGLISQAEKLLNDTEHNVAADLDIILLKAELLRKQGFYTQAISLLAPWQEHYQATKELALCHNAAGNIEQAQTIVSKQLKLAPADPALLHLLSELRWQNADANWLDAYTVALQQQNVAARVYLEYANKLQKTADYSAAEQIVDAGLKHFANNSGLLLLKGYLRREAGAFTEALKWLADSAATATDAAEAQSEQVVALLAMQNFTQATSLAQNLCRAQPLDQARWALVAACYKFSQDSNRYRQLYNFDNVIGAFNLAPPSGFTDIAAFNRQLLQKLHSLHVSSQHPLQQSLRQGTQTEDHLFCLQDDSIQLLQQQISAAVAQYIAALPDDSQHPFLQRKTKHFLYSGAWSVRLRQQGFHRNHYHGDGWISGCYYVSIPDAVNRAGSGWIKFGQPELGKHLLSQPDYLVKPEAGLLVLFPSMMWHGTEPFNDEQYRVTVAFDIVPQQHEDEL